MKKSRKPSLLAQAKAISRHIFNNQFPAKGSGRSNYAKVDIGYTQERMLDRIAPIKSR